ncbi:MULTISPECIES: outer membrane protein assembly factor BamE [Cupriavidus]|uniref:Outer membrane protein assembly factor BamE n=1 Tax=Cupriavidus pinatubonensis (strain JMP 134 / LMG 1197) TaxID=264198 RepID=Q46XD6_CUPPJ|nr:MULTISPECIES: outer membrane protein assembly factor BamE [Cupriavidus]QYY31055.1 outer membrane protein assembly factor BamE [Cupriavidus pinatubonensis]TPQ31680.1 outer membrane protein assembly factor BamE [Cupriavidus pinatubonensis]
MRSFRSSAMRPTLVISLLAAALLAGACSTYDSTSRKLTNAITPYRINIVQGNFVSREAASQLHEGMTRDQVKFLLGTPLLTDVFHADRWDYVFSFRRGNAAIVQQRRFTVYFDGDKLVKFGGDELPSEYELIAEIDGMKKALKDQKPGIGGSASSQAATAPAATPAAPQDAPAAPTEPQAVAPETSAATPAAQPAAATQPESAPQSN